MCTCLEQVQKQLAEKNAAVVIELAINLSTGKTRPSPPSLRLEKLDTKKRNRLPVMFCSYCPFCGEKYA